ncbi:putative fluoride ion transporter CrcB [compost metagenome]
MAPPLNLTNVPSFQTKHSSCFFIKFVILNTLKMIKSLLIVGLGGALGSIFRYLTSLAIGKYMPAKFPLGTFTANILGCFIIGLLFGYFEKNNLVNSDMKLFFATGFCGGYTTFSTFGYENISLFQSNNSLLAFAYIGASLFFGLLAVWFGLFLTK